MVNGSTNADAERVLAELRRNDVSWKNLAKGWKLDNLVQVLKAILRKLERRREDAAAAVDADAVVAEAYAPVDADADADTEDGKCRCSTNCPFLIYFIGNHPLFIYILNSRFATQ